MSVVVHDVVIVGAGLAGLTAAYRLKQHDATLKVLVLEAKDRVGGRTTTTTLKSASGEDQWDLGGQWVGSSQVHIMELLKDLDIGVHKQYNEGAKFARLSDGKVRRYTTSLPFMSPFSYLDLFLFIRKVDQLCHDVNAPYKSNQARALDSLTLENFKQSQCWKKDSKEMLDSACGVIFGAHPSQISLLFYLHYCKCAGGLVPILENDEGSGQEWRIKGCAQNVSLKLVKNIGEENVLLGEPVDEINQERKHVKIKTKTGEEFFSKYVIMAIPPHQALRVNYEPCLPFDKSHLLARMPVGHIIKFIITYPSPFWREQRLSGEVVSFDGFDQMGEPVGGNNERQSSDEAPVSVVYDATSSSGNGALVGFISGLAANRWTEKSEEEQKHGVVKFLTRFFGAQAEHYLDFAVKDWSKEPYNGGCPVNYASPGAMSIYQDCLKQPFERVHWSGTETASLWCGFMNGAVQTGTRSANEVLRRLKPDFVPPEDEPFFDESSQDVKGSSNSNYWKLAILSALVLVLGVLFMKILKIN